MTISIPVLILLVIIYTAIVITIDRIVVGKGKSKGKDTPVNRLPYPVPDISDQEKAVIPLYQTEWKTIIETQMHFNDLIIRFRSIVLTAFITLVGASVALQKAEKINEEHFLIFFFLLLILWAIAFVMDYFYYHHLLLGSVAQALKFDESDLGKRFGLFGLTTSISRVVHPPAAKRLVILFYGIPIVSVLVIKYIVN